MKEPIKVFSMNRKGKEELYIQKMTQLQLHWKNPIDSDWDFVSDWTDKELDENLEDTIAQLRFEKILSLIKKILFISITIFIVLGLFGLLLFGIRQIF